MNMNMNMKSGSMAMFATLKPDNIPLDSSSLGHYNSAPDTIISNWLDESSSCEVSQLAELLVHRHDLNGAILPLNELRERPIGIEQVYSVQIDHPSTTDYIEPISQYTLPPIHEHKGEEEPLILRSDEESFLRNSSDTLRLPNVNLTKHSSLPSEFLSSLAREELNQRSPCISQNSLNDSLQEISLMRSESELSHNELLRQNSYSTGLLVQFSSVGIGETSIPRKLSANDGIGGRNLGNVSDNRLDFYSEMLSNSLRKRGREAECQMFEVQPREYSSHKGHGHIESNQFSIPRTIITGNMDMDVVVCKSRAKRGFATDPRSIAERVRRTKISDGMKKLHDLLPITDKQAHTADMLDEVVEYVKQLQHQVQELSENYERCAKCKRKEEDITSCVI